MAWYDGIGDIFSSEDSSGSASGTPDSWYSVDSVADSADDYSDLFNLSGTVTEDPAWWSSALDTAGSVGGTILKAANTPLGVGVIGGLASGYQSYQAGKDADKATRYTQEQLAEHKRSIATGPPEGLAKKVKVIR